MKINGEKENWVNPCTMFIIIANDRKKYECPELYITEQKLIKLILRYLLYVYGSPTDIYF